MKLEKVRRAKSVSTVMVGKDQKWGMRLLSVRGREREVWMRLWIVFVFEVEVDLEVDVEDGDGKRRCVVKEVSIWVSCGWRWATLERMVEGVVAWRAKRVAERAEEWVMKEPP